MWLHFPCILLTSHTNICYKGALPLPRTLHSERVWTLEPVKLLCTFCKTSLIFSISLREFSDSLTSADRRSSKTLGFSGGLQIIQSHNYVCEPLKHKFPLLNKTQITVLMHSQPWWLHQGETYLTRMQYMLRTYTWLAHCLSWWRAHWKSCLVTNGSRSKR